MSSISQRIAIIAAAIAAGAVSMAAHASFHTFVINEIFSNADGTIQFVELREAAGASGQGFLTGIPLISSSGANHKTFTFPGTLPSQSTAGTSVLIGTRGFADLHIVAPDYIVPNGFLFVNSGSVNYGNVDTVSYMQLPVDGFTSISRNGTQQTNSPKNFVGDSGTIPPSTTTPTDVVTEFYNTMLNHYFLTANPIEGASIDSGGSGPGWTRTGNIFKSGGPNPVCRFFGVQAAGGPNGHFYTANADECAQVKLDPGWRFESLDFAITPAQPGGVCAQGLVPVYRAYNGRFAEHDSNHRITASFAAYQQQLTLGWIGEGVVMCAQQ